jgi:hypothetical protein
MQNVKTQVLRNGKTREKVLEKGKDVVMSVRS